MNKDEINEKVRIETNILTSKVKTLEEENKELKSKINEYDIRLGYLELKDENIKKRILNLIINIEQVEMVINMIIYIRF